MSTAEEAIKTCDFYGQKNLRSSVYNTAFASTFHAATAYEFIWDCGGGDWFQTETCGWRASGFDKLWNCELDGLCWGIGDTPVLEVCWRCDDTGPVADRDR